MLRGNAGLGKRQKMLNANRRSVCYIEGEKEGILGLLCPGKSFTIPPSLSHSMHRNGPSANSKTRTKLKKTQNKIVSTPAVGMRQDAALLGKCRVS